MDRNMLLQSKLTHPHKTSRKFRAEQYWWGGVGLLITASSPATAGPLFRFNPLGGGAGSRVRVHATRDVDPEFRFNPLGGGAGSGSDYAVIVHGDAIAMVSIPSEVGRGRAHSTGRRRSGKGKSGFQSPRRWGGVGLQRPCLWIGYELIEVSIPSEVGRGRALDGLDTELDPQIIEFQSPRR